MKSSLQNLSQLRLGMIRFTKSLLGVLPVCLMLGTDASAFNHPGLFNNAGDLNRDKAAIASNTEPWRSAWERLQNSYISGANGTWTPSPVATVTDTGSRSQSILNDGTAAYVNAIEWYMTGNQTYANTAINILNAWSSTCTTINGSNAQLAAGIDFVNMVNAAEILRYSNAGWSSSSITAFQNFLINVVYPPCSPSGSDSWGSCSNTMMMMIGVFCNNQSIYNQGYNNFLGTNFSTACWTSLFDTNSVSIGQSADSWRDQGHAQLSVNIGVNAAEVALNSSGQNLFKLDNNLLLSACEYAAKYNLGHGVTWDGNFGTSPYSISSAGRGRFWPFYAMAQAGFTRSGLSGPYTNQVVTAEGIESINSQGSGLGTLLYTQANTSRPSPRYALLQSSGFIMAGNNGSSSLTAPSPCIRNLETFQEDILGNGYSALNSFANGKYVTANGATSLTTNSTYIGTAQEFKIIDMGDEAICLVSAANGEMVDLLSSGLLASSLVYDPWNYNAIGVYAVGTTIPPVITNLSGNTYRLTNLYSNLVADDYGSLKTNGTEVDQYAYNGGNNQKWTFSNVGNGVYTLVNVNSGLNLDLVSWSGLIDQWQATGGANQSWVPQYINYADGSGNYNLYSCYSAATMNVIQDPGASTAPDVQLNIGTPNGGSGQQWSISTP